MTTPLEFARQTVRAAVKIHERLSTPAWSAHLERFPDADWDRLRTAVWRLKKVRSRGWHVAAANLFEDIDYQAAQVIRSLEAFRTLVPSAPKASRIAPPSQIAADLAVLPDEFESVQIDLNGRTVSVRTEPLELESLWLGPFDICLWWERIGVRHAYEVIAKDPQRPCRDEEVTHPHVRSNLLCEGDATLPIKAALAGGRLLDFFVLVHQTLQTYNSGSPYVAVEEWNGIRCPDCGYSMDEDSACRCEACDSQLCSECTMYCRSCDRYVCSECSGECSACQRAYCQSCLTDPPQAFRRLCAGCRKKEEEEHEDQACDDPAPAADAVCLGQAAAAA
jgi:hypothetical protein